MRRVWVTFVRVPTKPFGRSKGFSGKNKTKPHPISITMKMPPIVRSVLETA